MTDFSLNIDCDNAAFDNSEGGGSQEIELARILRLLAETIEWNHGLKSGIVRDINGNKVGNWELIE